jgi:hypothetical protein
MIEEYKRFQYSQIPVNNKFDSEAEKTRRRNTPQLPPPLPHLTPKSKQYGGVVYANRGTLVPYEPRGTDTVPAMLTPGEFVVNRESTQKHLPLLKNINSGGYAAGGEVYKEEAERKRKAYQDEMERRRRSYLQDKDMRSLVSARKYEDNGRSLPSVLESRLSSVQNRDPLTYNTMRNYNANLGYMAPSLTNSQNTTKNDSPEFGQILITLTQSSTNFNNAITIATKALQDYQRQIVSGGATTGNSVSNNGAPNNIGLDGLSQFTDKFNNFVSELQKINLPPIINVEGTHKVEVVVNGASALQNILQGPIGDLVRDSVKNAFDKLRASTEGGISIN